jgi:hypothetical protein
MLKTVEVFKTNARQHRTTNLQEVDELWTLRELEKPLIQWTDLENYLAFEKWPSQKFCNAKYNASFVALSVYQQKPITLPPSSFKHNFCIAIKNSDDSKSFF